MPHNVAMVTSKAGGNVAYCTTFRPTTDAIRVKMKNSLQNEAGSLNTKIPTMTVPTAPIPVQTGYAVPRGMVFVAFVSSTMLRKHRKRNAAYHNAALFPVSILPFPRQNAKPVSHSPATINRIQSISAKIGKISNTSFQPSPATSKAVALLPATAKSKRI